MHWRQGAAAAASLTSIFPEQKVFLERRKKHQYLMRHRILTKLYIGKIIKNWKENPKTFSEVSERFIFSQNQNCFLQYFWIGLWNCSWELTYSSPLVKVLFLCLINWNVVFPSVVFNKFLIFTWRCSLSGLVTYLSPPDTASRFSNITEEYFKTEIMVRQLSDLNPTGYHAILSSSWVSKTFHLSLWTAHLTH